jgi:hypothetical protein
MLSRFLAVTAATFCACGLGFAQVPAVAPAIGYQDSFQTGFFTNGALGGGDGSVFFPFTNAGFHASPAFPVTSSDICVNAYIMASDGAMASCCSCRVPANAFVYILDGPYNYPGSNVTVKLISTLPARTTKTQPPSVCEPQVIPSTGLGQPLGYASGMRAWTESLSDLTTAFYEKGPFSPTPLSTAEVTSLTKQCAAATQCACLPAVNNDVSTSISTAGQRVSRNPFGIR